MIGRLCIIAHVLLAVQLEIEFVVKLALRKSHIGMRRTTLDAYKGEFRVQPLRHLLVKAQGETTMRPKGWAKANNTSVAGTGPLHLGCLKVHINFDSSSLTNFLQA